MIFGNINDCGPILPGRVSTNDVVTKSARFYMATMHVEVGAIHATGHGTTIETIGIVLNHGGHLGLLTCETGNADVVIKFQF